MVSRIKSYFPILQWLTEYKTADLPHDLLSGLFVTILLIPQATAYAVLADLPPQVGLYAAIAPPLLYAIFGTSRYVSLGPVALVSLLVADAVGQASSNHDASSTEIALILATIVGLILLLMGLFRLGFLVNFISSPVLTGFTNAAAILIATSQLSNLLGIELARSNFLGTLGQFIEKIESINPVTAVIGIASLILLTLGGDPLQKLLKKTNLNDTTQLVLAKLPALILVIVGTVLVSLLSLNIRADVVTVGPLDSGWPPLTLPLFQPNLWLALLPSGIAISVITFVTATAVANTLAGRRRQQIKPSQEAIALGAANLSAAFTGGYPIGASISRSAVNFDTGAQTPASSAISATLVLLVVLFLGPLFEHLPKTVLAALIISAVFGLFNLKAMRRIWRTSLPEAGTLVVTFFSVLFLGVDVGIAVGAISGLLLYLWRSSQPRIVIEGRLNGGDNFRSVEHEQVEKPEISPVLVLRMDRSLYFANTSYFEEIVLKEISEQSDVHYLLLNFQSIAEIDISGLEMLERLFNNLSDAGVSLYLAEVKEPVQAILEKGDLIKLLGDARIYLTVDEGVEQLKQQHRD